MKLQVKYFQLIKEEKKRVEFRLYDEKRQKLKVGDIVEFQEIGSDSVIHCEVEAIYIYSDFQSAILNSEIDTQEATSLEKDLQEIYSPEEIKKYGVCALKIKLISEEVMKQPASITIRDKEYITTVTELILKDEGLTDAELAPLSFMSNLKVLKINRAKLADYNVLASLSTLEHLKIINYEKQEILDLSPLQTLKNLEYLRLTTWSEETEDRFDPYIFERPVLDMDLFPLSDLTRLKSLHLSTYFNIRDLSALTCLTNLTELDLASWAIIYYSYEDGDQIVDLSPISKLQKLKDLSLSKFFIIDFEPLLNLTSLEVLYLYDCNFDDVELLGKMSTLKKLFLEGNPVGELSDLGHLQNLEVLNADSCGIRDLSPIKDLKKLRALSIGGWNKIGDLSPVSQLSNLEYLNLWGNDFDFFEDEDTEDFEEEDYQTRGKFLDLTPLSKLTKLQDLTLVETRVKDISPLQNLKALESLILSENNIEDISVLSHLTKLTQVWIDGNPIEDSSPLRNLPDLEELWLGTQDNSYDDNEQGTFHERRRQQAKAVKFLDRVSDLVIEDKD